MNRRKLTGYIVCATGCVLALIALYAASYLAGITSVFAGLGHFFSDNPVSNLIGGEVSRQTSTYVAMISACFWTGFALFTVGLIMILAYRKANKRR